MMISTLSFPCWLMLITEWLLITMEMIVRGGNLPLHALKSTIEEMLTSLKGEAAIWFIEIPYNSIYTWNQLNHMFLARYTQCLRS